MRDFVGQERIRLSRAPAWVEDHLAPRSVVVRAFVANSGDSVAVLPGGLTRVALKQGSLVVNSSQGGGTKDTWILDE